MIPLVWNRYFKPMFVISNCPLISCLILTTMMLYVDDVYFTRNHAKNTMATNHVFNLVVVLFAWVFWCTPKLLDDSTTSPKGENNERRMSWGALLGSQHFHGKRVCWSFRIIQRTIKGLRTMDPCVRMKSYKP